MNNLWSAEGLHQLGSDDFEAQNRLEAEIGYGVLIHLKNSLEFSHLILPSLLEIQTVLPEREPAGISLTMPT